MDSNTFIIELLLPTDSFDTIYTDMDSTLVLWAYGAVNNNLLEFLQRQKALGKKIVVLTRAPNPDWVLPNAGIEPSFFDEIISVGNTPKSQFIPKGSAAIFVDDKIAEREDVFNNAGILAFDPNSLWFRKLGSFPPDMRTPLSVKIGRLKQELASMQEQLQGNAKTLKNFAHFVKKYFDSVQDCSVIDMNQAVSNSKEEILQQRIAALKQMEAQRKMNEQPN